MDNFDKNYWQERWKQGLTGWDIGSPSTPLVSYFESIENKELKILIPGCGNAYEGEYLIENGFQNTFVIDIAPKALKSFRKRFPSFPKDHLIKGDFFELDMKFDLIVEQTFFCALDPSLREKYAEKCLELLKPGGKLMGVLFDDDLFEDHPPFGGHKEDYLPVFKDKFVIHHMEKCYNSIKPRAGRELFIELQKPK